MRWMIRLGLSLMIVILLSSSLYLSAVHGETAKDLSLNNDAEDFPVSLNDLALQGNNARQDVYFELSKGRKVTAGSLVNLLFTHSQLLLDNTSLTVLMDDIPFESIRLGATNQQNGSISLDISNSLHTSGLHKLSFVAHMNLTNSVCPDPNNVANWIIIKKLSHIHLNLIRSFENINLTLYPSPFFEKGSLRPLRSIFVVPDEITQDEFRSASKLVQYFSNQATASLLNIPIYAESDVTDQLLHDNNAIWIGQKDRWKQHGQAIVQTLLQQSNESSFKSGFIGVVPALQNNTLSTLLITGNPEELANAAVILTESTLYSQLLGNFSPIPATMQAEKLKELPKVGEDYEITFEGLGYGNTAVQEVTKGSTHIYYTLPGNWDIENGAKLHLKFSHSESVAQNKSIIAVKLNGVPLTSQHLNKTKGEGDSLDVLLKNQLIGVNRTLDIEVSFEFNNDNNTNSLSCSNEDVLGNWGVIDKSSTLTFTAAERKSFDLQSFPFPFLINGIWQDTTFVLPAKPTPSELNVALTLAGILGKNAQGQGDLNAINTSDSKLKEKLQNRHIIYVGTAAGMPQFMNGFNDSWVQFTGERVISRVNNVELLNELQTNSAIIQLSKSPLNENRSLLMVTAASANRLSSISNALSSTLAFSEISGKLTVIDSVNQIHAFEAIVEPVDYNKVINDSYVGKIEISKTIFTIVFVVLLLLMTAAIWLMRKRW